MPVQLQDQDGPAIQLRQIVKEYKTPAGDFTALRSVDLDFFKGDFVGITGKSGSGKSTLINMITGIDKPTSGDVRIVDTNVQQLSESEMAKWRGRNLGIVFQFYQLLPMLSLLENVILPMDFCDMYDPAQREPRAFELLKQVGLEGQEHKMPSEVSGGQQQAAAIARALANDPPFIIADEPTGNLDSRTAEQIFELFETLSRNGKTILMITHDPALAERTSRQVLLSDGEVVNEWIHRALPMLSHSKMLLATHRIHPEAFKTGMPIIQEGDPIQALYIITKGRVNVEVCGQVVAQLFPGQYFGEIELLRSESAVATVRAASDVPAEILSIDRDTFTELIAHTRAMRESVTEVMQERLSENRRSSGNP